MKLYLIYRKDNDNLELYAITDEKKYLEKFLDQRNSKLFTYKKVNADKEEVRSYKTSHSLLFLTEDILCDKDKSVRIISTRGESIDLTESCDDIVKESLYIIKDISNHPIKEKYKKAIKRICKAVVKNEEIDINTVDLFMDINKATFVRKIEED